MAFSYSPLKIAVDAVLALWLEALKKIRALIPVKKTYQGFSKPTNSKTPKH